MNIFSLGKHGLFLREILLFVYETLALKGCEEGGRNGLIVTAGVTNVGEYLSQRFLVVDTDELFVLW